ncbi:MAG: agmatine deiminase family protein [Tannerella sp.]|jgi:agmatine/peptidylarginine deiminase|nr:agmatine deiminase family protein [Tannerella sp.]
MDKKIILPPEWHPQSAVQLTWPNEATDWQPVLDEVAAVYTNLAREIVKHEKLITVCNSEAEARRRLQGIDFDKVIFRTMDYNDTWARDHAGITVFLDEKPVIYDFVFNGWGMKYPANLDNLITRRLAETKTFHKDVEVVNMQPFVLEGGSIESDGKGTILTTAKCLASVNRNEYLNKEEIECHLKNFFGAKRILRLENGYLQGDDTDGHIDTLARFCNENTIAYVKCADSTDEHYEELKAMEDELKAFRTLDGKPYSLVPLPMADEIIDREEDIRLPATYANFLIINDAVIMPFYGSHKDAIAKQKLQNAFPHRNITGIDSRILLKQHGSLHCVAMQFPEGVVV